MIPRDSGKVEAVRRPSVENPNEEQSGGRGRRSGTRAGPGCEDCRDFLYRPATKPNLDERARNGSHHVPQKTAPLDLHHQRQIVTAALAPLDAMNRAVRGLDRSPAALKCREVMLPDEESRRLSHRR